MTLGESNGTHQPVMADEVVELLATADNGTYIDLTVGSGGHLRRLSAVLRPTARLYGVDRDPAAVERTRENLEGSTPGVEVVLANYADLAEIATRLGVTEFDGILLDLGLSSDQLDDAGRGFAFRLDGPLDMRFNPHSDLAAAAELVNTLDEDRLIEILRDFGQERKARRMAAAIVRERQQQAIRTTADLTRILTPLAPRAHLNKTMARVFQAFRIAVNNELEQLTRLLPIAVNHLAPGGRMAAITYHSLEDRIVKQFFLREAKDCLCPPRQPVCTCGHKARLKIVTRRGLTPSTAEMENNRRSRSARLRVAERLAA